MPVYYKKQFEFLAQRTFFGCNPFIEEFLIDQKNKFKAQKSKNKDGKRYLTTKSTLNLSSYILNKKVELLCESDDKWFHYSGIDNLKLS